MLNILICRLISKFYIYILYIKSSLLINCLYFCRSVLLAEILKYYYPRYVDLHNYIPANNFFLKKDNWNTLNRKVLTKIDIKLNKDIISSLANCHQGSIEKLLFEIKNKVERINLDVLSLSETRNDELGMKYEPTYCSS